MNFNSLVYFMYQNSCRSFQGTGRLVRTHSFSPAPPDLTFDKRGTSPLQGLLSVGGAPSQTQTIMQMSDVKDNPLVRGLIGGPASVNSGNNLTKAKQWTHRELVTTVLKVNVV